MKRVLTILSAFAFAISGLFFLAPEPVEASCSQASVYLYENVWHGGDGLRVCYGYNISDLRNITHTQPGYCESGNIFRVGDHWDDCISSARFDEASLNTSVCLYTGYNYTGSYVRFTTDGQEGNWFWGSPFADSISSVRFGC